MSRYGRNRHEEDETGGDAAELNLTPYLDIMMNLVIFLIFSFQVIIEFRLIDVVPPAVSSSAAASSNPDEKPKPTITLVITKEGYRLLSTATDTMPPVEIPKKGDKYDQTELHDRLVSWKRDFGLGNSIVFTADLETEYQVVVEAMDTIRMDKDDLLFPDVLLARAGGVK